MVNTNIINFHTHLELLEYFKTHQFYIYGCAGGVMNSSLKHEIGVLSSNFSRVCYIHFLINTLEKDMNISSCPSCGLNITADLALQTWSATTLGEWKLKIPKLQLIKLVNTGIYGHLREGKAQQKTKPSLVYRGWTWGQSLHRTIQLQKLQRPDVPPGR